MYPKNGILYQFEIFYKKIFQNACQLFQIVIHLHHTNRKQLV
jgi:hypothetical protein